MFKTKGTITLKVLEAIESKLKAAEQNYADECEKIDNEAFQKKADALAAEKDAMDLRALGYRTHIRERGTNGYGYGEPRWEVFGLMRESRPTRPKKPKPEDGPSDRELKEIEVWG